MRKLLVMGAVREDTFRQDNEYGNVASRMLINPAQAAGIQYAPSCRCTTLDKIRPGLPLCFSTREMRGAIFPP